MAVTSEQAAAFRAQLAGRTEEHERLFGQLDPAGLMPGYNALVAAAFFEAADQRFAGVATRGDVVDFVAGVRSRTADAADRIDPRAAERILLAVLTDDEVDVDDLPFKARFQTRLLLLAAMVADKQYDDAGLDEFLGRARKLADQWLA